MRWAVVGAVLLVAVLVPTGAGKGLDLSLRADQTSPTAGRQVTIALRGATDLPIGPCRRMRVVVVAPGISVRQALRSLEGGRESRRIGRWDAFRLASLRSVGELSWTGRLRPNRSRWTLIVPNRCAEGFVLPEGVTRLYLDVRPANR